jgi:hypothetical protein
MPVLTLLNYCRPLFEFKYQSQAQLAVNTLVCTAIPQVLFQLLVQII